MTRDEAEILLNVYTETLEDEEWEAKCGRYEIAEGLMDSAARMRKRIIDAMTGVSSE